jgi:ubiquinone/menaquinone biosynthesis C-methylase UbiE
VAGSHEGLPHPHKTSQGHTGSDATWLDIHFEASRPEYVAMLDSVGLQPDWHVLDAGCGSGSFLPLIAAAVGPAGRVVALDPAPENIASVEKRLRQWTLACPVDAHVGNVLALPFEDGHFDGVWCANVSAYLTDDELGTALWEFRRVVRPGGLVAIKEIDATHYNMAPADPVLTWRLFAAVRQTERQIHGTLRTPQLRRWLEHADFEEVWQRTTLAERWAPLRPAERAFFGALCTWYAAMAEHAAIPEEDRIFWRGLRDPEAAEHPMQRADFSYCDGQAVVVGRVPLA